MTIPGPAASVLNAILVQDPDGTPLPMGRATFSQSGEPPALPSLANDVVPMPQDGLADANLTTTGFLSTLGLTGATAPARWVGGTTSGAPTTGTWLAGDFVIDQSGFIWVCNVAGSPGSWNSATGGGVTSVTAADTSVIVGGTVSAPIVSTNTLDVIAADHPPAAAVAMNSKKITGLANGTTSTDAAAFGQVGVTSLTAADTSIVVAGTAGAPTVATNTLDVIAADHPAAANWSNNSHKITSLLNGSSAQDAAAFGQIPTADSTAANILANGNQAAGSNGHWADSGHVHPAGVWVPADNGLLAATSMLDAAGTQSGALTAGTVYLNRVNIRVTQTYSTAWWLTSAAGTGASTGSFVGLYSSAGTLLTSSSDIASKLTSTGAQSQNFTTPQSLTAGTFVWVALVVNLATTQPQLRCSAINVPATLNLNLTAANFRSATNGTGQTSLPGPITPSSNTSGTANSIWFGLS
jgi:hypothetical protein